MEDKDKTRLGVLFSKSREVEIGEGEEATVKMKRLPLHDIDKVFAAFDAIASMAANGIAPSQIAIGAAKEISALLPYCLEDQSLMEILPATALPFLMEAVVEMNFTDAMLVKWTSLVEKFASVMSGVRSSGQG